MNERIKQLATEAEFSEKDLHIQGDNFQKFAELIIQECVQACINEGKTYVMKSAGEYASNLYATAIKEHFGVEE